VKEVLRSSVSRRPKSNERTGSCLDADQGTDRGETAGDDQAPRFEALPDSIQKETKGKKRAPEQEERLKSTRPTGEPKPHMSALRGIPSNAKKERPRTEKSKKGKVAKGKKTKNRRQTWGVARKTGEVET